MIGFGQALSLALAPQGPVTPAFDPRNIATLSEWFDFRVLAGAADGDPIGELAGRKGLYTLTASGIARPTWATNDGDGFPSVLYDGENSTMHAAISNEALFGTTGNFEFWLVVRLAASQIRFAGCFGSSYSSDQVGLSFSEDAGVLSMSDYSVNVEFESSLWDDSWHVIRCSKNGASRLVQFDGTTIYSASTSAGSYVTGPADLFVGFSFGFYMNGAVRHWLATTAPLDDATAALLNSYLEAAK
ncbi:MAG: hypothetical protein B7Z37_16895 [Verrucomicrobia bacterium 12-59-8]|nr:MAG: hypothetical protein B7Z37_16895 [Verrucomicrobia bacterium 12-59-8]